MTRLLSGVAALAAVVTTAAPAQAVPAFARKYAKSCVTCHTAYPKLTAFGEAFRINGYRFPAGEDEDATAQEPVEMGHDVHKKVWPDAVWPATLPGNTPVGFQLVSWINVAPDADNKVGFDQLGGSVIANIAGTVGDRFAAWGGVAVRAQSDGTVETELERVFVHFKVFEESAAMNVRLGRFEPAAVPHTSHRTLGFAPWYSTSSVQDNPNALEPTQTGLEVNGVLAEGRVAYAAGVVEGSFDTPKDVYGRVAYKLGGMRLDGIGGATSAEPWRDDSLRIGTFGYLGFAELGDAAASQDDRFWIAGGDVAANWWRFNLLGAVTYQRNERPSLANPTAVATSWHVFTQVDFVAWPWLQPTARYERRSIAGVDTDRLSAGLYALIRPNVRAQALAAIERPEGEAFDLTQVLVGLNLAL